MTGSRSWRGVGVAAALAVALAGCSANHPITQTAFERSAAETASIMSAAALTLRWVHSDPARLTVEYGRGSMISYADQVATAPEELPFLPGAPDAESGARLVALLDPAVAAVEQPCLLPGCDWEAQVSDLETARDALLAALE